MRLARLSLAALALVTLTACSNDATAPEEPRDHPGKRVVGSSGPSLSNGLFGSGMKNAADSVFVMDNTTSGSIIQPQ